MKTIRFVALILLLLCGAAVANAFRVKAIVVDAQGEPQAYASYRFYLLPDTSAQVLVGTADDKGEINAKLRKTGNYRLIVSYIGVPDLSCNFSAKESNAELNLGQLKMTSGDNTLGTLEVVAQKPLVTKEIDRVGYDVQGDEDSKTQSVSEILRKVPMVAVDADGTITVNGSSNFKIFKDGRPSKNYTSNAKDLFKAIPASMIKRIEVITEPGAKYDAEGIGAILNIVTMDGVTVRGAMGTVSTSVSNVNPVPSLQAYLSGQLDKVNLSFYGGTQYIHKESQRSQTVSEQLYNNGNVQRVSSEATGRGGFGYFGTSLSWEPDTLNLFNFDASGTGYKAEGWGSGRAELLDPAGKLIYGFSNDTEVPAQSFFNIDASASYQRNTSRKGEFFTLAYQISTQDNRTENNAVYSGMVNMPVPYTGIYYNSKLNFIEHTFQADWTRPTWKGQTFDVGGKYILRRNKSDNKYDYAGVGPVVDKFLHITDVGALYTQYALRFGTVSLRAGLRYEMSKLKAEFAEEPSKNFGSTLHDFVPSADMSWSIDDRNSLTLNYATRINRPGIEFLNPAHNQAPSSDSYGNPALKSVRHNSLTLNYSYTAQKLYYNVSTGFEMSNNGIVADRFLKDNVLYSTYINAGQQRRFNMNAYVQWTLSKNGTLMFNGTLTRESYSQNGLKLARWTPMGYTQYRHRLPWKLNASVTLQWHEFGVQSVYNRFGFEKWYDKLHSNFSLGRNFLKEDRLTVQLQARNPFGPSKIYFVDITENGDVTGTSRTTHFNNTQFSVSVSYRFGSFNSRVKKTARSISNDDLVGGAQKGTKSN